MPSNSPLILIIRDGWGLNPNPSHDSFNAPLIAHNRGLTPTADRLDREWPRTLIKTCGEDVGIPEGTMGNSEVGHQNIGAGRIVDQESVAITKACRPPRGLDKNQVIAAAITKSKAANKSVHLLGLASDAGVHGMLSHLYACLEACKKLGQTKVCLHLFTDGRDTGPFTGIEFIRQVEAKCKQLGVGRIASIMGRYYAMDRDYRWERVQQAYGVMTGLNPAQGGAGLRPAFRTSQTSSAAIQEYYDNPTNDSQKGDEFIIPTIIGKTPQEQTQSRITDGDTVIFYNYRGDRPREISAAFVFPDDQWARINPSPDSGNHGFDRGKKLQLEYVIMTEYWEALLPFCKIAFPRPPKMTNIGGEYLSSLGLQQFRCAETEKYPHVTFFFNDYRDQPFPGEVRENPQSPKVATYDLKPEMSAALVRDAVLRRLAAKDCQDVLIVNFANPDMVGHTGNLEAVIKACTVVDQCAGAIMDATLKKGGSLIITADHGNCEQMFDPTTNSPHTSHTVYDVPLYVVGAPFKSRTLRGDFEASNWFKPEARDRRGRLADILPTALDMLGLAKPPEMTGTSLLSIPPQTR